MKKYTLPVLAVFFLFGILLANCGDPSSKNTEEIEDQDQPVQVDYRKMGTKISRVARRELGNKLAKAIATTGTVEAIRFCNTHAMPLTDSVARAQNAQVKRVSDKARNPDNLANESELAVLNEWKRLSEAGDSLEAWVFEDEGKMVGYYPIKTNGMCLQCHGIPEKDILPEVYAEIKKLYPEDKATGYGLNEVRGMFVVVMDKKANNK